MRNLTDINFENTFVENFKGDLSQDTKTRQTPDCFYSTVLPSKVSDPKMVLHSKDLAKQFNLSTFSPKDIEVLSGNTVLGSMKSYAACYGGHQFGNWAGQLGDGRAITLGELRDKNDKLFELQLKGAGLTPYSRRADGRAVFRSSFREYIMSEAMFYLNIPTTRALSLVTTGDKVLRDMFYDGNPEYEPGAIVARVSPSFIRFGHFEILASRNEIENLKSLCQWTIKNYFPDITGDFEQQVQLFYRRVVDSTAELMVHWQRVGFVHGVMNTDNMSILGLTIDYGPYSFMDFYDPKFTPNTTDLPGRRYAYGNQPNVAYWNLARLAEALSLVVQDKKRIGESLHQYQASFFSGYYQMMANKIGFSKFDNDEDLAIIKTLDEVLFKLKIDMTIFYQLLIDLPSELNELEKISEFFKESFYESVSSDQKKLLKDLIDQYQTQRSLSRLDEEKRQTLMSQNNPRFILRNYMLYQAISEFEQGDASMLEKLNQQMINPYDRSHTEFFKKAPDWAQHTPGSSTLSCSS